MALVVVLVAGLMIDRRPLGPEAVRTSKDVAVVANASASISAEIVATLLRLVVSITVTLSEPTLLTYANAPSGLKATSIGVDPTETVTMSDEASTGVADEGRRLTRSEPEQTSTAESFLFTISCYVAGATSKRWVVQCGQLNLVRLMP